MGGKFRQLVRSTVGDEFKGTMNATKSFLYMLRHYKWKRTGEVPKRPIVVFNVDGNFYSGGMADRFKGAVTAYAFCKQRGLDFRIRYVHPFELSDYLVPAEYDWRLRDGEYTDCLWDAKLMYARAEYGRRLYRQFPRKRQLHFYGNYNNLDYLNRKWGTDYRWGTFFRELFRPAERLQKALDKIKSGIEPGYMAAVFRFQNLLGDFPEYRFSALESEEERRALMDRCLDGLQKLMAHYPEKKFLVTSDSGVFLSEAARLDRVFIIPGKVVHLGSVSGEDYDVYLKSFIDFFMLSEAERIYCIGTQEMYPSEFPMYAAKLNDVPFERITL